MSRRTFAVLVAALIGSMLWVGTASAASAPAVRVTPSLHLSDGQSVSVSGSGYPSGAPVFIGQCTFGTGAPPVCGPFSFGGFVSGSGTFTSAFTVDTTPGAISCLTNACTIVASAGSVATGALIWFSNNAGTTGHLASTSPSADLVDGQTVTVSGTEWNTGWMEIRQCMTVASDGSAVCTPPTGTTTLADLGGSFSGSFTVQSEFDGPVFTPSGVGATQHVDCSQPQLSGCFVFVSQGAAFAADWQFRIMPIAFVRLAASTGDCKNGGWADVVDSDHRHFRNQGDCVSFVATGGRNTARS